MTNDEMIKVLEYIQYLEDSPLGETMRPMFIADQIRIIKTNNN